MTAWAGAVLAPLHLRAKEGLSLLNGTEGMLAMGVLSLDRGERLARTADVACAKLGITTPCVTKETPLLSYRSYYATPN